MRLKYFYDTKIQKNGLKRVWISSYEMYGLIKELVVSFAFVELEP